MGVSQSHTAGGSYATEYSLGVTWAPKSTFSFAHQSYSPQYANVTTINGTAVTGTGVAGITGTAPSGAYVTGAPNLVPESNVTNTAYAEWASSSAFASCYTVDGYESKTCSCKADASSFFARQATKTASMALTSGLASGIIVTTTELGAAYTPPAACCNECRILAEPVRLFYWPPDNLVASNATSGNGTATNGTLAQASVNNATSNTKLAPRFTKAYTIVSDGFTYTSPSVYVVYSTLNAVASCIPTESGVFATNSQRAVGGVHNLVTRSYAPNDLSTWGCPYFTVSWRPLNYSLLYDPPPMTDLLSSASACFNVQTTVPGTLSLAETKLESMVAQVLAEPRLSLHADLSNVDPAWSTCTPMLYGGFDPPRPMVKASSLDVAATPTDSGSPAPQTPAASPGVFITSPQASPTGAPTTAGIVSAAPIAHQSVASDPAPSNPPANNPPANSPAANSPAANSPAVNSPAANSPAANSPAANTPTSYLPVFTGFPAPAPNSPPAQGPAAAPNPVPAQNPAPQNPAASAPNPPAPQNPAQNPPVSNGPAANPPTQNSPAQNSGQNPPVQGAPGQNPPTPGIPAQGVVPAQNSPAPGQPAENSPAPGQPAQNSPAPGIPAQNSPAPGVPAQNSPIPGIPAQNPPVQGSPAQNAPAQGIPAQGPPAAIPSYPSVAVPAGSQPGVVSPGAINVPNTGGSADAPGNQNPAQPGGLAPGSNAPPPSIGGQPVQQAPGGGVIIGGSTPPGGSAIVGGSTIPPGAPVTIGGVPVTVASDHIIAPGGSTVALTAPSVNTPGAASGPGVGSGSGPGGAQVNSNGALVVAGATINPGSQQTVSGHVISVDSSSRVIVDSSTYAAPVAAPSSGLPAVNGQSIQTAAGGGVVVGGSTVAPGSQATIAGHIVSAGPSNVIVDANTFSVSPALPTNLPAVNGQSIQTAPGGGVVVAGSTIAPGSQATISGHVVSAGPSNVIVDASTFGLPAPTAVPDLLQNGVQPSNTPFNGIVTLPNGAIISAGGNAATVSGKVVSVLPNDNGILVGSSTVAIPSNLLPSSVVVAGQTLTAAPNGPGFAIGTNTLSAGGSAITVSGTQISILPNNGGLLVGSSTVALPAAPSSAQSVFTVAGQTFTAAPTGFAIGSSSLSVGGSAVTISGTVVSLGSAGLQIGSSTVALPPQSIYTVGGSTFTAAPTGFSIAGTTLTPGGSALTISGTVVSLGSAGLQIGSSTVALAPQSVYTVAGQTFTVAPTGFSIAGTSLTPGGSAVTISGTVVSLGPSGSLQIGSSTLPLIVTATPTGISALITSALGTGASTPTGGAGASVVGGGKPTSSVAQGTGVRLGVGRWEVCGALLVALVGGLAVGF